MSQGRLESGLCGKESVKLITIFQGYTNADNPFGDEHLTDTFVWNKKIEKEGKESLATDEIQHMTKQKMEETRVSDIV